MTAIEFLRRYRPNSLVKSSARGEYQLAEHDSFKINGESSVWHWKSRDIGGKSALKYLIYVEGVPFVEAVQLLCEESPMSRKVKIDSAPFSPFLSDQLR